MSGVQGGSRKHLRRVIDEVHRIHRRAVEFEQVEAWDIVVGICESLITLQTVCQCLASM